MEKTDYNTAKNTMKRVYDDLKVNGEFDKENEDVATQYYKTLITLFESAE